MSSNKNEEHEAVTNFREYLRIPTVHPDVDYSMYNCIIIRITNIKKCNFL